MNKSRLMPETLAWSASGTPTVDLAKGATGFLTELDLDITSTLSASAASDMATFGLWRLINNLSIKGGRGTDYLNISGVQMGVLLHYLNLVDFPTIRTWRQVVATTQRVSFKIHFGAVPSDSHGRHNPYDLSAAIPILDETSVILQWGCPGNNVVDDTITISSAVMSVTEHLVLPESEAQAQMIRSTMKIPVSSSEEYNPGGTKSALSGGIYVPTGNWVKRISIAAQDDTAVGSFGPIFVADQLTEVGLQLVKDNRWLVDRMNTTQLQMNNPRFDGMEVVNTPNTGSPWAPAGLYHLDMRKYQDRLFGLNTRGYGANDLKLAMTIGAYATGEVEQIFHEQYKEYAR